MHSQFRISKHIPNAKPSYTYSHYHLMTVCKLFLLLIFRPLFEDIKTQDGYGSHAASSDWLELISKTLVYF
jgi:hypothetical protein